MMLYHLAPMINFRNDDQPTLPGPILRCPRVVGCLSLLNVACRMKCPVSTDDKEATSWEMCARN
jgi:hypothetical protein